MKNTSKTAIIIGAGPAGLTAAYELLDRTDIKPVIFEMSGDIGGISKTVVYKGNRIDLGGHRFFSKSDRVMDWWRNILPLQGFPSKDDIILERTIPLARDGKVRRLSSAEVMPISAPDPEKNDRVMLVRNRLSRIFFLRRFFDYPVTLNMNTFLNLGIFRVLKIGLSYIRIRLFPIRHELSLEDFFINRFGRELYLTFFKDYTEKVWGVPCSDIKAEWGAQRIKGLSISKTIAHAVKSILRKDGSIEQKTIETSLIEQFLYPKLGPGQMWEEVAGIIRENGGELSVNHAVTGIVLEGTNLKAVIVRDGSTGEIRRIVGDYFFSTMPVKDMILAMGGGVPNEVKYVANGLMYRDFITVGLLLRNMKIKNLSRQRTINNIVPDTWIYIQERDVRLGRLQIFNNWSPYMVKDKDTIWIGLEYFCNEGDDLWSMQDDDFKKFAITELVKIDIIEEKDVLDSTLIRMPKTYPAYFGTYDQFQTIRDFTDRIENLFMIGRNGMHRYNNQDHSMLTAMTAVDNIINGVRTKDNIWEVNTEKDYHEKK